MTLIDQIAALYQGNILLHPPYQGKPDMDLPEEIAAILRVSNGIEETMLHPKTGERISISWVVYPYELLREENIFFQQECGLEGFVFSNNGTGEPYVLKPDGTVVCYDPPSGEETREAGSLAEFYRLPTA